MVRLCRLRLFCHRHRPPLLPARGCGRPASFGLRRVRDRLCDATNRWRRDRPYRRPVRAPHSADLLGRSHGDPHLSDRTSAGIRHARPRRPDRADATAHGAGAFGRRRIYELDGIPGRACPGWPPRRDGRASVVRRHRWHPARLGGRRRLCSLDVGCDARRLGLAHSVPARLGGGDRGLLAAPACYGDGPSGAAQTRPDHGDAEPSLAHRARFRGTLGVQRRQLLRRVSSTS